MSAGRHSASAGRGRSRRLPVVVAVLALVASGLGAGLVRVPEASASGTPYLPFELVPAASSRLVLAHYVPWFPVSFDNRPASADTYATAYLTPSGEGGKHSAYGGYLRDRPLARAVSTDPAWRDDDVRGEVREAIAAGIDGFAVDIPSVSPTARSWSAVVRLLKAAHDVDPSFRVLLQPDMVGLARFDGATISSALASLASYPAAMRLPDGRLVVSPYFAEKRTVAWWTDWIGSTAVDHGVDVALFPVLQNDLAWADDFAPISIGVGNWGSRNPAWNSPTAGGTTSPRGRIAAAHARGDLWMQPVSVQDERPRSGLFDEAANTQNLRDTWQVARDGGADWVLLPTWNDYAEGTAIAPSTRHGRALLDLVAYYASWFKDGRPPQIVREGVYLTHRTQLAGAVPEYAQTTLMSLRGGTPARDTVEALSFLTAPATVSVTVGGVTTSCTAAAGVSSCVAPLRPGTVGVVVTRSSGAVASVASPYPVDATPYVQDLQYVAVSSLRSTTVAAPAGTASAPPTRTPAPSATPSPKPTATVAPSAPASPAPTPSATAAAGATTTATSVRLVTTDVRAGVETRFAVTVSGSSAGTVRLWVDGAPVGASWPLVSGGYTLGTGSLPSGRYTVVAEFAATDPAQVRGSQSAPFILTVP